MSRSYQKVPGWTNNGRHTSFAKKQANKVIRHAEDIPSGGFYRRLYCSWNIHDYRLLEFGNYWVRLWFGKHSDWYTDEQKHREWYRAWMHK